MSRWIFGCWTFLLLAQTTIAQPADENLAKGRDLLLAEEYHPAQFYLRKARADSKNRTDQLGAEVALAELLLLTRQPDSATALVNNFPPGLRMQPEVQFLSAFRSFQENDFDRALPALIHIQKETPSKNVLLKGKIDYYTGVIHFRKRSTESIPLSIRDLQNAVGWLKKDSAHAYLKLALARLQLADVYRLNRQNDAALPQLRWATKILEISPYAKPLYLASAYGIEGRLFFSLEKYGKAKEAFEKSIHMQLMSGADSLAIGINFGNLGLCFDYLHELSACEKAYSQTAAYWSSLKGQSDRMVGFLNNSSMFLHAIQEPTTALEGLHKAKLLVESGKLQSQFFVFQTYYNLALVYYDLEDFSKCKEFLDHLDNFVKENPTVLSPARVIQISQLKAMWLRKEKQFDQAVNLCKDIDSRLDSAEVDGAQRSDFYSTYGDIMISADQLKSSAVLLHKARALYISQQDKIKQVEIDNLLAMNFFNQHAFDSAIFYAGRALQINSVNTEEGLVYPYAEPQDAIQSCYLTIAAGLKQFQQTHRPELLDKVIPFERLGIDLIRSIRKNLYSDADRITYNKNVTKFYDACCALYFYRWQNHSENAAAKFFEYVEESKFQALSNSLNVSRVNSFKEVNDALVNEEKDLAKQKILGNKQLVQLLALTDDEAELGARKTQAREQLRVLEMKHERFMDSLRRNFSGYYLLKYGGQPITLDELKAELQAGQLVLQIKVIDSLVVVQAITRDFTTLFLMPKAETIRRQVAKLRNLIQFRMQPEFVELAHTVFQSLIAPLEADPKINIRKKSLVTIVPDDFFYLLPFEALVEQIKPLRYFIQSHEISYAYSCNIMVQNKRDVSYGLSKNFLGIAPHFQPEGVVPGGTRSATALTSAMNYDDFGFQPLKENENEVNLIGKLVNDRSLTHTLLNGEEADEANLKKLDLSKFRYVHFATHGFVNANNSGLSGLALTNAGAGGEDNILFTSEIYKLNLRAELVCLSACETGLGQGAPGEGLIGLGRAFFYAGANNLLVSLWKVPDESTSQFMIDFYERLFNPDERFPTSLRQAKLKMIKTTTFKNPYYWAPFILIGSN